MQYWNLEKNKIIWKVKETHNHKDHIEMSGSKVSLILHYGVNAGKLFLKKQIIFPLLRTIPNDTHAHSEVNYDCFKKIFINNNLEVEKVNEFIFDGVIRINSSYGDLVNLTRIIYPSTNESVVWEQIIITNTSTQKISVKTEKQELVTYGRGTKGSYTFCEKINNSSTVLNPGESFKTQVINLGYIQKNTPILTNAEKDLEERYNFINKMANNLVLQTDDEELNTMFFFSKIRGCESIFKNQCGYLHSPGGGRYYAAIWTNDQLEYAAPFFPLTGYKRAIEASLNAFKLFIPFMNDDFHSIPSSIISEGLDIWEGAGDRGDSAMYLYGVTRLLLLYGDKTLAKEMFYCINWCISYIKNKIDVNGVVCSDSDELENRFESGNANLCTSCLAYDGLKNAAIIALELGFKEKCDECRNLANSLEKSIEEYFGSNVMGYETYKYYKDNVVLRSWICMPLTVGIYKRKEETIKALLSDKLWTENGISTQSGEITYWDRATLYALRGIFSGGKADIAFDYLKKYTFKRLLCDHVPYPIEAFPEGDQRHLSAESILYSRVITEGLFGINPAGFNKITIKPQLPQAMKQATLRNIHFKNKLINIEVVNYNDFYNIKIYSDTETISQQQILKGESVIINV